MGGAGVEKYETAESRRVRGEASSKLQGKPSVVYPHRHGLYAHRMDLDEMLQQRSQSATSVLRKEGAGVVWDDTEKAGRWAVGKAVEKIKTFTASFVFGEYGDVPGQHGAAGGDTTPPNARFALLHKAPIARLHSGLVTPNGLVRQSPTTSPQILTSQHSANSLAAASQSTRPPSPPPAPSFPSPLARSATRFLVSASSANAFHAAKLRFATPTAAATEACPRQVTHS